MERAANSKASVTLPQWQITTGRYQGKDADRDASQQKHKKLTQITVRGTT